MKTPSIYPKDIPVELALFLGLHKPLGGNAKFIVVRNLVVASSLANVEAPLRQLILMLLGADQVALAISVRITITNFAHIAFTPRLAGCRKKRGMIVRKRFTHLNMRCE
jgi:hypothetical protein